MTLSCQSELTNDGNREKCKRCDVSLDLPEGTSHNRRCKPWTVPEILRDAAATYEERNKQYGNNYKQIGDSLASIFPDGLPPMNAEEWNCFSAWFMLFGKTLRYGANIGKGGHKDSAHDGIVYSAMLEELTQPRAPQS